jgi:hypothetical protein
MLMLSTRSTASTESGERLIDLRPVFDELDTKLAVLGQLRAKPAGKIQIKASENAAETIFSLWRRFPGLSAALHMAESGGDVVVVDAARAGGALRDGTADNSFSANRIRLGCPGARADRIVRRHRLRAPRHRTCAWRAHDFRGFPCLRRNAR